MKRIALSLLICACVLHTGFTLAGVVNPDCTAEKAAKSAAAKATVGVGGRCSPAEAARDSGKKVVGVEDKGPVEKRKSKNNTPAEKVKKAVN